MSKFWNQPLEIKAIIISLIATFLGFGGTMFLFWFHRYDIPLGVLIGGLVISLSWFLLYINRRKGTKTAKLDIVLVYLRLTLIIVLALLFTILELVVHIVTVSPISMIIAYLLISLLTLLAYIKKGENDV